MVLTAEQELAIFFLKEKTGALVKEMHAGPNESALHILLQEVPECSKVGFGQGGLGAPRTSSVEES